MESNDILISSDKTDVASQSKIMNNSEDKDDADNCAAETSQEDKEGTNESWPNKDSTEEVHDDSHKANEEASVISSEKDSIPSNMDACDSAIHEGTIVEDENTKAKEPSFENDDKVVIPEENNTIGSSCDEIAAANVDKETIELNVSNLMQECDKEYPSNSEASHEIANNAASDCLKSSNDSITNELETPFGEKRKDRDIPDESSVNADDIQVSRKEIGIQETDFSKKPEAGSSDNNFGISGKNMPEKNIEFENTEFIQFSHDKNDDPQNEVQSIDAEDPFGYDNLTSESVEQAETDSLAEDEVSFKNLYERDDNLRDVMNAKNDDCKKKRDIDCTSNNSKDADANKIVDNVVAEDPFGGDNLTSESVEQTETDSLAEDEVSFKNLYEQGDNLQDAVNAKNDDCKKKRDIDCTSNNSKNADVHKIVDNVVVASTSIQSTIERTIESLINASAGDLKGGSKMSKTKTGDVSSTKSLVGQDGRARKDIEEISIETDVEQTNVLPGQDDELCIIPDSMKVIIPNKSVKAVDSEQSDSAPAQSVRHDEAAQKCSKSDSVSNKDTSQGETTSVATENTADITENFVKIENQHNLTENTTKTADIINIEDETKNLDLIEILTKETCKQCREKRACKIQVNIGSENYNVCSETCKALFKAANDKTVDIPSDGASSKREKRCATCLLLIELGDERNLSWETMDFCNEECLGKFQRKYGSFCKNCYGTVQTVSLGKYCVRFGCDVRQFCCSTCLEEFKKGLKVCSYCQKDISFSTDGFLAPVGEKGQFKDFCAQDCMEKYTKLNSMEPPTTEKKPCSVCKEKNLVHCEVQIYNNTPVAICSEPCFAAFKFVKQVKPEQCSTCKKFFELPNKENFVVFYENEPHTFCTKTCLNIFIITNRKIVPCNWCKVKKYNFDMIKKELKTGQLIMMCSLNCLTLYQVSINAVSAKRIHCDFCKDYSLAHYHLTMSDATIRNFCSYNCVMNFQAQYTKSPITIPLSDDPVPTGAPKRTMPPRTASQNIQKPNEMQNKKNMPVISSVTSLAAIGNGQASPNSQQNNIVMPANAIPNQTAQIVYKQQIITRPPTPVKVHNKRIQCKPLVHTKGVSVRPRPCTKSTQTDEIQQVIVPIPVPIYVPFPMHMYSMPFPVPVPFPLPIPIPFFIPTTRNSAKGIMKDIKRIQEKIPADPYEAELLMMAEMVATEKKANDSDSDSVDDRDAGTADQDNLHSDGFSPEAVDSSNTFGEDMLQMALKMATGELDEPAVDLEAALTPNTITATQAPPQTEAAIDNDVQAERLIAGARARKRITSYKPRATPPKRMRRVSGTNDMPLMPPPEPQPPPQPRIMEPMEKPDANMALKYTFGVNAWRQWVIGKNAELEKQITPMRKIKLFKTDLLQLTADELNYSLCLFVKEVRKPNGAEYAPDTIYYLCLGIQQYLFENNRIDNIFTDSYYEKFTDCLNDVAKKFSVLYNEAQYIVTRVEEEHLWECKQLGAHSPHVLLSTLMFFNTKHFNLVTVEEHMQLSFSHIMKHWKRNPAAQPAAVTGKVPGSRNVLLRFYPPQSALDTNSRKKKVYEQQENEENPLRCPVKLYEFYLSKCPESVKTRNDVFYLLPERSCVPDSPVWYSTSPLAKDHLIKMLYRIKMVKEINVALLTS